MSRHLRKRLLVDKEVQLTLVKRFLLYCVCIVVFITLPIAISQTIVDPSRYLVQHYVDTWCSHWPILATLTVLMPFVIYDTLRITNRFAGPIFRLRRELQRFASGEDATPVRFRNRDFWPDLGTNFCDLMERVRVAEARVKELEASAAPSGFPSISLDAPCSDMPTAV